MKTNDENLNKKVLDEENLIKTQAGWGIDLKDYSTYSCDEYNKAKCEKDSHCHWVGPWKFLWLFSAGNKCVRLK